VVTLLHLAVADEIKLGGMIGQVGFQEVGRLGFPNRSASAALGFLANETAQGGIMLLHPA
jgi:hypothetical protein